MAPRVVRTKVTARQLALSMKKVQCHAAMRSRAGELILYKQSSSLRKGRKSRRAGRQHLKAKFKILIIKRDKVDEEAII